MCALISRHEGRGWSRGSSALQSGSQESRGLGESPGVAPRRRTRALFNRPGNRVRRLRAPRAPPSRTLHPRYKLRAITPFEVGH